MIFYRTGSQQVIFHPRLQDPSKELIAESQRVKIQLRNLEKQLNNLKIAAEGVTLNETDRLTQELQLIEQGIQEKQKEACLVCSVWFVFAKSCLNYMVRVVYLTAFKKLRACDNLETANCTTIDLMQTF